MMIEKKMKMKAEECLCKSKENMRQSYKISDLIVSMDSFGRSFEQARPYQISGAHTPDIVIKSNWQSLKEKAPHLSDSDCEYLSTGGSFYRQLVNFDGLMLHSSAVIMEGKSYLFSAPCGTGKSTHTKLWLEAFGDKAAILNDDKPALRRIDGVWYAYGTPWSGKHDISINTRVPLGGICVLRRGEVNSIERFGGPAAIKAILEQTTRSKNPEFMGKLLALLDKLMSEVPVWRMECNMDPEAAVMSYKAMSGTEENNNEA